MPGHIEQMPEIEESCRSTWPQLAQRYIAGRRGRSPIGRQRVGATSGRTFSSLSTVRIVTLTASAGRPRALRPQASPGRSGGPPCEGIRVRTAVQSGRPRPGWVEGAAAFAIYVVLWIGLLGRVAVTDPAHTCACPGEGDPASYMWALVWWPHALIHGLNPFVSHVVWTPEGGNVAAAALVPAAGLLLSPVTAAFGPIVAYNVLTLLGPVLSAWMAFRLCRYVTGRWGPSLLGGYIFGFSSYVLAHTLGHPNLILVFLVPAAVHLVLLWLDERVSTRRFGVLMTGLITLQVLLSTEVLVSMVAFGAVALALTYLLAPERRRRIRELVPPVLGAGAVSAVLVSPYLYYALKGLGSNPSVNYVVTADR
jgi:hypothetical protein